MIYVIFIGFLLLFLIFIEFREKLKFQINKIAELQAQIILIMEHLKCRS